MTLSEQIFGSAEKCFALVEKEKKLKIERDCNCLNKLYCNKKDCNFYKPKSEVNIRKMNYELRRYNEERRKAGDEI